MKKILELKKGFAMAELLTVSIVILFLFSVLIANFLPLVGEYESRLNYNNVTAEYAAFHLRKIYRNAVIPSNANGKNSVDNALRTTGYVKIYDSTDINAQTKMPNLNVLGLDGTAADDADVTNPNERAIREIIRGYEIEKIYITRYVLARPTNAPATEVFLKEKARNDTSLKSDAALYNYIKYLPDYKNSRYAKMGIGSERYRLIIKTKSYGFATMQILPDPPTNTECFDLDYVDAAHSSSYKSPIAGFVIKKYTKNASRGCDENIRITGDSVSRYGKTGPIIGIKENAFKGMKINTIDMTNNVKYIGNGAFMNNNISIFSFEDNGPGIVYVGQEAFAQNRLTELNIPLSDITFGKGAFKDNTRLTKLEFSINRLPSNPTEFKISDEMFMGCVNTQKPVAIDLEIPLVTYSIGDRAFQNMYIKSVSFVNETPPDTAPVSETPSSGGDSGEGEAEEEVVVSNLTTIGSYAFQNYEKHSDNNFIDLAIPYTVQEIGSHAFQYLKINDLLFENSSETGDTRNRLEYIGRNAFDPGKIYDYSSSSSSSSSSSEEGEDTQKLRTINIPPSVKHIGASAFINMKVDDIIFEGKSSLMFLGNEALSNNYMRANGPLTIDNSVVFTFPVSLFNKTTHKFDDAVDNDTGNADKNSSGIGNGIFGKNTREDTIGFEGFGTLRGSLLVEDPEMLTYSGAREKWCKIIFGDTVNTHSCTFEETDLVDLEDNVWIVNYNSLINYLEEYHALPPVGTSMYPWLKEQREAYKSGRGSLNKSIKMNDTIKTKKEWLNKLNTDYNVRWADEISPDDEWNSYYEILSTYVSTHDGEFPDSGSVVYDWLSVQYDLYTADDLRQDRLTKLNTLGDWTSVFTEESDEPGGEGGETTPSGDPESEDKSKVYECKYGAKSVYIAYVDNSSSSDSGSSSTDGGGSGA